MSYFSGIDIFKLPLGVMAGIGHIVADNIKHYRRIRGLTQEDLAYEVGVNLATVKKWETDRTWISKKYVSDLAKALGVQEYELFQPRDVQDILTADDKKFIARFAKLLRED